MKNYAFLFLPLMLFAYSCEQYAFTEINNLWFDSPGINKNRELDNKGEVIVEPMIIETDYSKYTLARAIEELGIRESYTAVGFGIKLPPKPPKGCIDPKLKGCLSPILLKDLVIKIPYANRENVAGTITDTRGREFAVSSGRSISFDEEEGFAYMRFRVVNDELWEQFHTLTIRTDIEFERTQNELQIEGAIGENFFRR